MNKQPLQPHASRVVRSWREREHRSGEPHAPNSPVLLLIPFRRRLPKIIPHISSQWGVRWQRPWWSARYLPLTLPSVFMALSEMPAMHRESCKTPSTARSLLPVPSLLNTHTHTHTWLLYHTHTNTIKLSNTNLNISSVQVQASVSPAKCARIG